MPGTTRLNARWLLAMDTSPPEVQEQQRVYIQQGRIIAIEPFDAPDLPFDDEVDLVDHVLMPGYINAHGHAAMSLFRGMADDLPLMTWLEDHIWPAENRWVNQDFVHQGTRLAIAEMLRSGTTTFADMYFYPAGVIDAAIESGMRCVSFTPVIDFPTSFGENPDDYIQKALATRDSYKSQPLVTVGLGPHAPYTVSDAPLRQIAVIAEELDMPVQIHLHETAFEVAQSIELHECRPSQRLAQLGFLDTRVSCAHMTQVTSDDIDIFRQTGASIVHCPESNLKLASGFSPVAKLLDANINIGLGTDGAASNNDLNLQAEMQTAALLAKAVASDASALPAAQALEMATIGSAKALGIDHDTGSIETGKWADLQAIQMNDLSMQPLYDPISQLVYTSSSQFTSHVWVAGTCLLENGEFTKLDVDALTAQAQEWHRKISAQAK